MWHKLATLVSLMAHDLRCVPANFGTYRQCYPELSGNSRNQAENQGVIFFRHNYQANPFQNQCGLTKNW
jgi:hypothetical protein